MNTATYVNGSHLFKFGGDIRAVQQNGFRDVQSRGFLNFSPFAYTGVALADLLLGLPFVTGVARVDNAQHLRAKSYPLLPQRQFSHPAQPDPDWWITIRVQLAAG